MLRRVKRSFIISQRPHCDITEVMYIIAGQNPSSATKEEYTCLLVCMNYPDVYKYKYVNKINCDKRKTSRKVEMDYVRLKISIVQVEVDLLDMQNHQ